MAYGSSYASEGRELPPLLLILVRGAAHELAHGLNTLIFLLDLDLRGDAYGARRGERRRMRGGDVATRLDVEHVYRHANDATSASWADRGDLPQDARGEKHDGDS